MSICPVRRTAESQSTLEGAGVRLRRAFAYVFKGAATFRDASPPHVVLHEGADGTEPPVSPEASNRSLVVFDRGDEIVGHSGPEEVRFLLVSGRPIEEPVAWHGPIAMNTESELQQAFAERQDGSFLRDGDGR